MAKFIKMAISRNSDINSFCRMNRRLWWIYSKALIKYTNTTHISKSCSFFIYRRYLVGKEPSGQLSLGEDPNGGDTPCNKSTDWSIDVITIEIIFDAIFKRYIPPQSKVLRTSEKQCTILMNHFPYLTRLLLLQSEVDQFIWNIMEEYVYHST